MKNRKIVKEIADAVFDYLKKNQKEELLAEVVEYLKKKDTKNEALVVSPRKLSIAERDDIKNFLQKLAGEVPGKINFSEDEKIIDGLKITYKDKLWDLSLQKQISSLTKL